MKNEFAPRITRQAKNRAKFNRLTCVHCRNPDLLRTKVAEQLCPNTILNVATYKFGNYVHQYIEQASVPSPSRIGSASTPGRAGEYAGKRFLASRQIKLGGTLIGDSYDDLQNRWSQLCASHNTLSPAPLFAGRDDWFLYALAENINDSERGISYIAYEIDYVAHDPHWYSVSEQNISVSSPSAFSVSTNGNAHALPRITFVISAAPAGGTVTLTNATTGESCVLKPTTTGSIIVDSRLETVQGGVPLAADQMGIFGGRFISLKGGALVTDRTSTIQLTTTGGATVSSLLINFRDRSI